MSLEFKNVKIFTATKQNDREMLGDKITNWIAQQGPNFKIHEKEVRQSSDNSFHCLSIIIFYSK